MNKSNSPPRWTHRGQPLDPNAAGFSTANAAKYIGWSQSFLKIARMGNTEVAGPAFKKHGTRKNSRVTYLRKDLDRWLATEQVGE